jgi:8-oxo-(d)GTP phosphatase
MLAFCCVTEDQLRQIQEDKTREEESRSLYLVKTLDEVLSECRDCILVVDTSKLPTQVAEAGAFIPVHKLPIEAVLNANPYLPPKAVTAAGGFVIRHGIHEPDVLLIFRRGVWDLPKGKLDAGESIEACALREVREEVGINELEILQAFGHTVHGYPQRGAFIIKTSHWYLMRTPQTFFIPQAEEDIEHVEWKPWSEAARLVGFEVLRRHMAAHRGTIHDLLRTKTDKMHEKPHR